MTPQDPFFSHCPPDGQRFQAAELRRILEEKVLRAGHVVVWGPDAWTKPGRYLAGLAVKERQGADGSAWTSVSSSTPGLPAGFWRNAARHAGAHVWCESDEVVLADASVVAIHSATERRRTLLLPRKCDVKDVVSGKLIAPQAETIKVELADPDTRVSRMEEPPSVELIAPVQAPGGFLWGLWGLWAQPLKTP